MKDNKIVYEGFFINTEIKGGLEHDIDHKHLTTQFKPKKTHQNLYGIAVVLHASKYAMDKDNEGYYIDRISTSYRELDDLFNALEVPHITLSVSETGKPVNTAKLDFENGCPIDTTFQAYFGAFTDEGYILDREETFEVGDRVIMNGIKERPGTIDAFYMSISGESAMVRFDNGDVSRGVNTRWLTHIEEE